MKQHHVALFKTETADYACTLKYIKFQRI